MTGMQAWAACGLLTYAMVRLDTADEDMPTWAEEWVGLLLCLLLGPVGLALLISNA